MESLPPILIVDDEADDVFILRRLLNKAGVENKLISFEDLTAAVAYLQGENLSPSDQFIPWLLFTDLHMPQLNGVELTRWVRSQAGLKDIVIIMTTSSEDPEQRAVASAAGVDRFLAKYPTVKPLLK